MDGVFVAGGPMRRLFKHSVISEYRLRLRPTPSADQLSLLVATISDFIPTFLSQSESERQKPSYVEEKRRVLNCYIVPLFGDVRLDGIGHGEIMLLRSTLNGRTNKTVNNVLGVLRRLLVAAKENHLIESVPEIKDMKTLIPSVDFYTFDEYERLAQTAKQLDANTLVALLLGGDAGLRRGEIIGLQWSDLDFNLSRITVRRAIWNGRVNAPKSNRIRTIPMTESLSLALQALPRLAKWVLPNNGGDALWPGTIYKWMQKLFKAAGMIRKGHLHVLRHTFCSHLAMLGAPVNTIRELAGHTSLSVTQRYMHITDDEKSKAVSLLNKKTKAPVLAEALAITNWVESGGRSPGSPAKSMGETGIEPVTRRMFRKKQSGLQQGRRTSSGSAPNKRGAHVKKK